MCPLARTYEDFKKKTRLKKTHWKNQFCEIPNASKFHNTVRDIFATDRFFKMLSCYQEVSVSDLIPEYPHNNHRFDWFIDELETVVELHGRQHYHMVNYGNIGYDDAMQQFQDIQQRDADKKFAALEAGYSYIEISYKHYPKLSGKLLTKLILETQ